MLNLYRKLWQLDERVRYGTLGSLSSILLIFVIVAVDSIRGIIGYVELYGVRGELLQLGYAMGFTVMMMFPLAIGIVLLIISGLVVIFVRNKNVLRVLIYWLTNLLCGAVLLPGIYLLIVVLVFLSGFIIVFIGAVVDYLAAQYTS